jgi:hypothetical protein
MPIYLSLIMFKRYLFLIDTIKKKLFSSSFYPQKDNTHELYTL